MIIIVLLIIVLLVIILFSSKTLSPIPYFPSQPVDMPLIVKALNLKNNQIILDLGAGDGIVIFKAADKALQKGLNTQFVAVEINPVLIIVLYLRRLFHHNRENIKILNKDIFKINIKNIIKKSKVKSQKLNSKVKSEDNNEAMKQLNNVTIYLYISPWFLEKTIENCKLKIENFNVVSYMYPIKSLKKSEKIIRGKNNIFVYNQ